MEVSAINGTNIDTVFNHICIQLLSKSTEKYRIAIMGATGVIGRQIVKEAISCDSVY